MTRQQAITMQKCSAIALIAISALSILMAFIILLAGSFLTNLSLDAVEQVMPDMVSDIGEIVDSKGLISMTIGLISGFMIVVSLYGVIVGVFGLKFCKRGDKAMVCLILGSIYAAIEIITYMLFKSAPVLIISLIISALFIYSSAVNMQKYKQESAAVNSAAGGFPNM